MYFLCCSMYCLFCDFPCIVCVYMCTEQLPPGGYPIAVKYIIYHISYHISCYCCFHAFFLQVIQLQPCRHLSYVSACHMSCASHPRWFPTLMIFGDICQFFGRNIIFQILCFLVPCIVIQLGNVNKKLMYFVSWRYIIILQARTRRQGEMWRSPRGQYQDHCLLGCDSM
jgi:hypothetical protein